MRVSEQWLREWADPSKSVEELADSLTMAGLECGPPEPLHGAFAGVVVGEVTNLVKHPNADKLRIAIVDAGESAPLTIVCGASNVAVGLKVPVAKVGAKLPDGTKIRATKLRGEASAGMLCSASELALAEESVGLLELPSDAPIGTSLERYLGLDDNVLELDLTPNRGDCLSVHGLARELGAITETTVKKNVSQPVSVSIKTTVPIEVQDVNACPRYAGRVVKGLDLDATTPLWMSERLRRSGIRSIHPVVDVTNYVLLELGQPMHGFDLANINGGIVVRRARQGEKLTLLDGREVELETDVLVISDQKGAKAMAGIMGGEGSGVQSHTREIFLESAFFSPSTVAGIARRYGLHTDASHRYERGVDPQLPCTALERATALLLDIAGGQAGPITVTENVDALPQRRGVALRKTRLEALLGMKVANEQVQSILDRLGFSPQATEFGWKTVAPSARFDVEGEHDLIEEVGRVLGFDNVPMTPLPVVTQLQPDSEDRLDEARVRHALVDRGYQEVMTYSFIDPEMERILGLEGGVASLSNPLSSEQSQLRRSLWPGLLQALRYNANHQQHRVRLFEIGMRFFRNESGVTEDKMISGVVYGNRWPEQWGARSQPGDFYDVKADIEAIFALGNNTVVDEFQASNHAALHPGRCAKITRAGAVAGWLGELHPALARKLGFEKAPILFELAADIISECRSVQVSEFSRFPSVRRDLAVIVDENVDVGTLRDAVYTEAGTLLRDLVVFDIYRGPGVDSGRKSVALGLILQESSRTLTDGDLDAVIKRVLSRLEHDFNAMLRD